MYVAITGKGRARVIQFCEQHRIPGSTKKKTIVVKTIGNYEKMLSENPNVILELKEEAKRLSLLQKETSKNKVLTCQAQNNSLFRFGHVLVKEMWKQLDLDSFFLSHFPEEGEKLSYDLLTLVVYRLGSSYQNFKNNRKIPFLNLSSLSEERFYHSLERIAAVKESLMEHLDSFFERTTNRNHHPIFCHTSSYLYHSYWKYLQKKESPDLEEGESLFTMFLSFDINGIPLFFHLEEDSLMDRLHLWKEKKKKQVFLSLSKELCPENFPDFLHSSSLQELDEEIQKKILEENRWHFLEKSQENEEVLQKEISFPWEGKNKFYVHWSKKRALKDYLARNQKQGYFCLYTNHMNLDNKEMLNVFQHIWKIEEKFLISEVHFEAKHIQGHFSLCFLCLCIIRYFQYLLGSEGKVSIPMIYANKAISNPMVLRQESEESRKIYPLHVTNSYLKLAKSLELSPLQNIMEEKDFEQNTKLSLEG